MPDAAPTLGGPDEVYRPWFGRMLTVAVGAICALTAGVVGWRSGSRPGLQVAPWLALVAGLCWATFWRPCVAVSDAGVRIVNVFRTIDVPWPALRTVDTKWAVTLVTEYGRRYTAWAAPSPGVRGAVRAAHGDVPRLARRGRGGPTELRPGDLPSSASGQVAAMIARRWNELRAAGHLDHPRLEHSRAPVRWHVGAVAGALALVALGLTGALA